MKVCKFGGSSLANASQIKKVRDIILSDNNRKIIVVSAPGKRHREDIKVTDLCIYLANAIINGYDYAAEKKAVLDRFSSIAKDMQLQTDILSELDQDLTVRIEKNKLHSQKLFDALKSAGEDYSARILAAYLISNNISAKYVSPKDAGLYVTEEYGNARLLPESLDNLKHLKDESQIVIFPGFFGYTKEGDIVTFSRGGSDITGSILAAATQADIYENWTDVDCVYAVNPNIVEEPRPIFEMTYDEMRELSYAGFSILHEESLKPAYDKCIPINIRNTNKPQSKGTRIVLKRENYDNIITGISGSKGFCLLNISKYLMNREVGFVMKILMVLNDYDIPFEHMPSGIDSISIILKNEYFPDDKASLVMQRLKDELLCDTVSLVRGLALVTIVGEAMHKTVGVTSRAASALKHAGINLEIINQGASEISVLFGIKEEFCNYAVKSLYREFF